MHFGQRCDPYSKCWVDVFSNLLATPSLYYFANVQKAAVTDILSRFRHADKYETFYEVLPAIIYSTDDQKMLVSGILDRCTDRLLDYWRSTTRPLKKEIRQILIECMDELTIAPLRPADREFGYLLGWYLAEKVDINLKKGTEKKIWGYWEIDKNVVAAPRRPRIAPAVKRNKKKPTAEEDQRAPNSITSPF